MYSFVCEPEWRKLRRTRLLRALMLASACPHGHTRLSQVVDVDVEVPPRMSASAAHQVTKALVPRLFFL